MTDVGSITNVVISPLEFIVSFSLTQPSEVISLGIGKVEDCSLTKTPTPYIFDMAILGWRYDIPPNFFDN